MTERHEHHHGEERPRDDAARLWGMYCAGVDRGAGSAGGEIDLMALAAWRDGRREGDDAAAVEGMLAGSAMPGVWLDDELELAAVPPGVVAAAKRLVDDADADESAVVYVMRRPWRAVASMAAAIGLCVLGYRAGLQTAALPMPPEPDAVASTVETTEGDFVADVSFGVLGDDEAGEVEAMVFAAELIGMIMPAGDGMTGGDG